MVYKLCLKDLRKKAGFGTQKAIADYLGIKERKYSSWEREEVKLTLEDACTLAVALGCTPNDLCGWGSMKQFDEQQLQLNRSYESLDSLRKIAAVEAVQGMAAACAREKIAWRAVRPDRHRRQVA